MSKSRLEKFLYAIYALDQSDLPTPLSRLEMLLYYLITNGKISDDDLSSKIGYAKIGYAKIGETIMRDFSNHIPLLEPLSRSEKYLMAILGVYDVKELPNPLSRVEVLLYKLATGDDNLDDVKSFISKHEELLAGIIRNGGVGGDINTEYVLYTLSTEHNTLYNTAEKPVKSAILKGQTYNNICIDSYSKKNIGSSTVTQATYELTMIDKSKNYDIYFDVNDSINNDVNINVTIQNWSDGFPVKNTNGRKKVTINGSRIGNDFNGIAFYFVSYDYNNGAKANVSNIVVVESNNCNLPYFTGMQSVKMPVLTTTGKNLFDTNAVPRMGSEYNDFKKAFATTIKPTLILKPNTTYQINGEITQMPNRNSVFKFVDNNGVEIQGTYVSMNNTNGSEPKKFKVNNKFTTGNNGEIYFNTFPAYAQEDLDKLKDILNSSKIQIEEGKVATEYEPYQSNILTVNEEVELRGIGEVKDELDLVTGEVTQRIGEVVFDGSEDWVQSGMGGSTMFFTSLNDMAHKIDYLNSISCDKLTTYAGEAPLNQSASPNGIAGYIDAYGGYPNENWIYIKYADSGGSVENFKQLLSQNPVTVQYELTTPVAKTVDISVVNQDGNNTELGTFDDLTHVTLSSEGLIPEAELEVATKNEEVLNAMSLEMDDISATQTTLEETSNTQSENVDATMIATTEIYEELL